MVMLIRLLSVSMQLLKRLCTLPNQEILQLLKLKLLSSGLLHLRLLLFIGLNIIVCPELLIEGLGRSEAVLYSLVLVSFQLARFRVVRLVSESLRLGLIVPAIIATMLLLFRAVKLIELL